MSLPSQMSAPTYRVEARHETDRFYTELGTPWSVWVWRNDEPAEIFRFKSKRQRDRFATSRKRIDKAYARLDQEAEDRKAKEVIPR